MWMLQKLAVGEHQITDHKSIRLVVVGAWP
jgi:hypothetical protein